MRRPSARVAVGRGAGHAAHARARRIWTRLPIMTTPMRIDALARRRPGSVLTLRKVMSVRIRTGGSTTATMGPKTPPRPPARLTPPRTTAATLSSVYGPGTGVPMPVLAVRRQAAQGREEAGQRVGDDLRPTDRDAAPEGRQPVAADGVDRQAEASSAGAGSRSRRRRRAGRRPPWGSTRCRAEPVTRSLSHCAEPPPGVLRTSSAAAGPDERHGQGDDDVRAPG